MFLTYISGNDLKDLSLCSILNITFIYILSAERFFQIYVTGLKFNKDFFEYRKYFIRQSGDRNWIFISHICNLIAHGECGDL